MAPFNLIKRPKELRDYPERLSEIGHVIVSFDLLVDMTSVFCAIVDLLESVG